MMDDNKAAEEGRLPNSSQKYNSGIPQPAQTTEKDFFLVTWNGLDDPEDPKNWIKQQKWAATLVRPANL